MYWSLTNMTQMQLKHHLNFILPKSTARLKQVKNFVWCACVKLTWHANKNFFTNASFRENTKKRPGGRADSCRSNFFIQHPTIQHSFLIYCIFKALLHSFSWSHCHLKCPLWRNSLISLLILKFKNTSGSKVQVILICFTN